MHWHRNSWHRNSPVLAITVFLLCVSPVFVCAIAKGADDDIAAFDKIQREIAASERASDIPGLVDLANGQFGPAEYALAVNSYFESGRLLNSRSTILVDNNVLRSPNWRALWPLVLTDVEEEAGKFAAAATTIAKEAANVDGVRSIFGYWWVGVLAHDIEMELQNILSPTNLSKVRSTLEHVGLRRGSPYAAFAILSSFPVNSAERAQLCAILSLNGSIAGYNKCKENNALAGLELVAEISRNLDDFDRQMNASFPESYSTLKSNVCGNTLDDVGSRALCADVLEEILSLCALDKNYWKSDGAREPHFICSHETVSKIATMVTYFPEHMLGRGLLIDPKGKH